MGNFQCIKIRVFSTNGSLGFNDSNFLKVYIFSRIFKKRELSENIYNAKNSTFTVYSFRTVNTLVIDIVIDMN